MPVDASTSDSLAKIWKTLFEPAQGADVPTSATIHAALVDLGVARYHVDLVAGNVTTYVGTEVDVYSSRGAQSKSEAPAPGTVKWSHEKLKRAVKTTQDNESKGKSNYAETQKQLIEAGVTDVTTYIDGKKVLYAGVLGDVHIEAIAEPTPSKPDARKLREAVGMVDI